MLKGKINNTVSRIAIVNPYLQGGHILIAETESSQRFIQAGKKLGVDVRVFASSAEAEYFDPDFIVAITYQEGKLTKYPTYVSLNIAVSLIRNEPRFVRNILSCDGFMTLSPSVTDWLYWLCKENNKTAYIAHAAFSVPKTEFKTCDFNRAVAMYMGTNWDGQRHHNLFNLFKDGKHLKCYGPRNSWAHYPESLYGGEIPFDGISSFHAYQKHAVGLCVNRPDFDNEAIASSRVFEIVASSALPICSYNTLTKEIYGDSVLHLDKTESVEFLASQITAAVEWVRSNSKLAQEMAKEAHDIFNKKASMEVYLANLIEMHQRVMEEKGYFKNKKTSTCIDVPSVSVEQPTATYILPVFRNDHFDNVLPIIHDICSQGYEKIAIIVLTNNANEILQILGVKLKDLPIYVMSYNGVESNQKLFDYLAIDHTAWVSILSHKDRIFSNHASAMLRRCGMQYSVISSFYIESSQNTPLPDHITDRHIITNYNRMRIGLTRIHSESPLCSLFFNSEFFKRDFLSRIDFHAIDSRMVVHELLETGNAFYVNEVTCSTNIDNNLQVKINEAFTKSLIEKEAEIYRLSQKIINLENSMSKN